MCWFAILDACVNKVCRICHAVNNLLLNSWTIPLPSSFFLVASETCLFTQEMVEIFWVCIGINPHCHIKSSDNIPVLFVMLVLSITCFSNALQCLKKRVWARAEVWSCLHASPRSVTGHSSFRCLHVRLANVLDSWRNVTLVFFALAAWAVLQRLMWLDGKIHPFSERRVQVWIVPEFFWNILTMWKKSNQIYVF